MFRHDSSDEAELQRQADEEAGKVDMTMRLREFFARTEEPPQIFAEMQELLAGRWVETARWVKYEEIADIDGGRWSTPHVGSFDGKAVACLQHLLTSGICLFNNHFQNIQRIADGIADAAVEHHQIKPDQRHLLLSAITAKHLHFNEARRGVKELFHKNAHVTSHQLGVKNGPSKDATVKEGHRVNKWFAKKLEKTAEGASIMVGAVEFLEKPLFVFLRQTNDTAPLPIEQLTEVDVPIKFIVLILGPIQRTSIMRDVGRVMAAALSDFVFQTVARSADSKADLLAGLKNFTDHATILAPGQWDSKVRLDPPKVVGSQEERKKAVNYEGELDTQTESHLLDKATVDPYDVHLPPGLQVTGRIFGGLVADIKRKAPFYLSDFKDGISVQCIAAVLFLFFIILTQMVSFGGLMGESTGNNIAAFETIVSASINGVIYHLFSGQPLNVISSTGPVLVFERLLFNLCKNWDLQFLEFRFWVGCWMAFIMLVIVMFDLSFMVCFITRFTEDNFAALIATIFIYESIKSIYKLYKATPVDFHPPNNYTCECQWRNESWLEYVAANKSVNGTASLGWTPSVTTTTTMSTMTTSLYTNLSNFTLNATSGYNIPMCEDLSRKSCFYWEHCEGVGPGCGREEPVADVFFFSLLLFIGTFLLATALKEFRNEPFFPARVRVNVSDFAVSITVFSMVLIDYFCGIPTLKLIVPKEFRPTNPDRPWMVPIIRDNPFWSIFAAFPLGMLASILLFMDHQITTVIINRKEHLLKKGFGYHLDLFIVTVEIVICSLFGITWLVAATVLAIGHANSLKRESESAAPGEKPKFLGLREQRVTGVLIFLLIGLSIILRDLLALIPMAVLYGCFLYMGCNVLRGCGIYQRVLLFFIPGKYQPDYPYLKHVRTWRVHYFTVIQLLSFACLWGLKEVDAVSMLFPLMLVVMVFIRKALDYVFTNEELHYLDDIMPPFHIPRLPKPGEPEQHLSKRSKDDPEAPPINVEKGGALHIQHYEELEMTKVTTERCVDEHPSRRGEIDDSVISSAALRKRHRRSSSLSSSLQQATENFARQVSTARDQLSYVIRIRHSGGRRSGSRHKDEQVPIWYV